MSDPFCPQVAGSPDAVAALHPLLAQLLPHLKSAQDLVDQWRAQQREGYELVYGMIDKRPVVAAGYRFARNLRFGCHLYVDDLATDAGYRGRRFGEAMLGHLSNVARERGCAALLLDTPMANSLAHRFYFRCGLLATALRFTVELSR